MDQITSIVRKIEHLSGRTNLHLLDVDMMLDYTRDLYEVLLEKRNSLEQGTQQPATELRSEPIKQVETPVPLYDSAPAAPIEFISEHEDEINDEPEEEVNELVSDAPVEMTGNESFTSFNMPLDVDTSTQVHRPASEYDIRTIIGINDKYLFISELFGNDKESYEETLQELNTFELEEDAIEWLNAAIASAYNWQEENDAVQTFYHIIHKFFSRR